MLNEKQQKEFEEMVNESIEDLSEPQCDEQEYIPLNDPEPDRDDYSGKQHMFQEDWMNWNKRQDLENHPHGPQDWEKLRRMDDAMVKPYEFVNKPKHYYYFGLQAIDIIEKSLSWEEFIGFLKGNSLKYRLRLGSKPNQPIYQDLKKAKWYENYYDEMIKRNQP